MAAAGGGPSFISLRPPPHHQVLDSSGFAILSLSRSTHPTAAAFSSYSNLIRREKIGIKRYHLCSALTAGLVQWQKARALVGLPVGMPYIARPVGQVSDSGSIESPRKPATQVLKVTDYGTTRTLFLKVRKAGSSSVGGIVIDISMLLCAISYGITSWSSFVEEAQSSQGGKLDAVYDEIGELFELGIQLSYLLVLLGLLGAGSFFVIRQVLVRRELDLSAKELQEQVRSGDATATEYFELGAVLLRRKFYPAAIKYLQQAIEKWDRDEQDLAQVYNALGVSYVRDDKLDKGISQLEKAVKLQPGYVTAWNNLGDAYEKKKDLRAALKAFEEVILYDPNNKIARPRCNALRERVRLYKGVPLKSEDR